MDLDENLITELFNNYINYYNSKNNLKKNIFDNINFEDKTSTNNQLEKFYDELLKFKILSNDRNCLFTSNSTNNSILKESEELYCLNYNEKEYYSVNLFTILFYITSNKIENWKIESLR